MANILVTSTADSGAGSLRQALADASSGDKIVFDATAFPEETETTIYLSSQLTLPDLSELEIDGGTTWTVPYVWRCVEGVATRVFIDDNNPARTGETVLRRLKTRVVLDRQELGRVVYGNGFGAIALRGLTFRNGKGLNSSGIGAGIYLNGTSENALDSCVFEDCSSVANGAGVYAADTADVDIANSFFENCASTGAAVGGSVALFGTNEAALENCVFDGCRAAGYGGAIHVAGSSTCGVARCDFNYCSSDAGGGAAQVFTNAAFSDCVFNGCSSTAIAASAGGAIRSAGGALSFSVCTFNQCEAPYGDALYGVSDTVASFSRCLFIGKSGSRRGFICDASATPNLAITLTNCVAYGNGAGSTYASVVNLFASTSTATVRYCTFGDNLSGVGEFRPVDASKITLVDSLIGMNVDFANVGFVDAANDDFRLALGSLYLRGATSRQVGDVDYLGHSRESDGAVGAFEGSWLVVKSNERKTIDADMIVDRLVAESGSELAFDGANRRLSARLGSTLGTATVRARETAYLAVPDPSSLDDAFVMGVVVCAYGAGLTSLSASTVGATVALSWTATDSTRGVLIEKKVDGEWSVLADVAGASELTATASGGANYYRAYDGENFLYCDAWSPIGVQYRVVSMWTPAERTTQNWEAVVQNVTTSEKVMTGQGITILARLYDAFDESVPLLNDGTNVASVRYTCFYCSNGLFDPVKEPVPGHTDVDAGRACVLDALNASDAWTLDNVGYNFALTPNVRDAPLFEKEGNYQIKVVVSLREGNPVVFYSPIVVADR